MMSRPYRDPTEIAFEIMMEGFSSVKRASVVERIELAWEKNARIAGLDWKCPAPPCEAVIPGEPQV